MSTGRKILVSVLVPVLLPFVKVLNTPERAARVFRRILNDTAGMSGVYFDEGGHQMNGSAFVRDLDYQNRVVAETRALLANRSGLMREADAVVV